MWHLVCVCLHVAILKPLSSHHLAPITLIPLHCHATLSHMYLSLSPCVEHVLHAIDTIQCKVSLDEALVPHDYNQHDDIITIGVGCYT